MNTLGVKLQTTNASPMVTLETPFWSATMHSNGILTVDARCVHSLNELFFFSLAIDINNQTGILLMIIMINT